jgi:hypothetical protein
LEQDGRAQILSRTTVTTLDSQPALINVGQITARPGDISQNATTTTQGINETQVGLVLGVTPRVTPDGLVIMEVDAEKSRLGDVSDSVTINNNVIRNINNVTASTTVSARSGQTVVFAGLIETTKEMQVRGIPYLSHLPLVGVLFRVESETDRRRELLIILTPHVIYGTDQEFDAIRLAESERMSWCLSDVMSLYGDVGLSHRPGCWCGCNGEMPVIFPSANPTGMEMVPAPAADQPPSDAEPLLPPPAPPAPTPVPARSTSTRVNILEPQDEDPATADEAPPVAATSYQPGPGVARYPGTTLEYQPEQPAPAALPHGMYPAAAYGPPPPGNVRRLPQTNR